MKKVCVCILLLPIVFLSCKKSSSTPSIDEVTYEVTLVNATSWSGVYLNENAQVVNVPAAVSGWRYVFKNTNKLVVATLSAYPNGTSSLANATMRIYVNGTVVAEQKSLVTPQVQYQFP